MINRPFRSLESKHHKDEVYRISGLRTTGAPTVNTFSHGVAVSATYVALPHPVRGTILALPADYSKYTRADNPSLIHAHGGSEIADLAFCPYADNVLASVGRDDALHIFQLPEDGVITSNITTAAVSIRELNSPSSVAWHPSARGVIAVGCKDSIIIANVDFPEFGTSSIPTSTESGRLILKFATPVAAGGDIVSISWARDGSAITAIGKDGALYVFDPRTAAYDAPMVSVGGVLGEMKNPMFAAFVGPYAGDNTTRLIVLGLGRMRKPTFRLLSVQEDKSVSSLCHGDLPSSSGQLLAQFDFSAKCLYVLTRSAQAMQIIDLQPLLTPSPNSMFFQPVLNVPIASGSKGIALAPRRTLRVMETHVATVYSHTGDAVEAFSVSAIRKEKAFHADLYPAARAAAPAIDFDAYMEGTNATPLTKSLDPYSSGSTSAPAPVTVSTAGVEATPTAAPATPTSAPSATAPTAAPALASPAALTAVVGKGYDVKISSQISQKLARTPFLHTSGTEPGVNKETFTYGLRQPPSIAFGRALTANSNYWAIPCAVSGGSAVYVRPHTTTGRFPTNFTSVRGPATASALCLSPHNDTLAVAGEDGAVRVYKLPAFNGEMPNDITEAAWTFNLGDSRVTWLGFHPYVQDMLVATVFDSNINKDVLVVMVVMPGTEGDSVMQGHPIAEARITDVDFCPDRVHVALATREHDVLIVALPSGTVKTTLRPVQVAKEINVKWVDEEHLLTLGFPRGSERSMTLFKLENLFAEPKTTSLKTLSFLNTHTMLPHMDITTGILIIGNVGSSTYSIFHITPSSAPYIDPLSVFTSKADCLSCAFLPKTSVNVREVEILRSVHFSRHYECYPISWRVPRKRKDFFQDDLYAGGALAITYEGDVGNWYGGGVEATGGDKVKTISLKPEDMTCVSEAPPEELSERQQRYVAMKQQLELEEQKQVNFLGTKTAEETNEYFRSKLGKGQSFTHAAASRWDAQAQEAHEDVSDSEW